MSAYRKLVSSEAIALIAALCIAAIFVGSYYQRRMDNHDERALQVAQQVYQLLGKAPAAQSSPAPSTPQTSAVTPSAGPAQISLLGLKAMGLSDPAPIQVTVLDSSPTAWKVAVEHPQGLKRYVVTPQGVKEEVR